MFSIPKSPLRNIFFLHLFTVLSNPSLQLTNYFALKNKSLHNLIQSVTDLDEQSEMIIFGLILTTFESSRIFGGGNIKNWLEPKTEPPLENLACPNP